MRLPTIVGSTEARSSRLRAPGRAIGCRGAAAAETAAVLPLLASTLVVLVWVVSLAATQIRVVDAAREGARVAARSDTRQTALAAARRVAPPGALVSLRYDGPEAVVTVELRVTGPGGLLASFPSPTARATATSVLEDR